MINKLRIADKLQHIQKTAKDFYGDSYSEYVKPFRMIIETVMKAKKVAPMEAFIIISETSVYQDKPQNQMLFVAALCDVIENQK